jgi:hypothetical protein
MNAREAEAIARHAHGSQLYAGKPYVDAHVAEVVRRVIAMGGSEDAIVVAWLHDVLEDCEWSLHDVPMLQLSRAQAVALSAITHKPGEEYAAYVARACADPLARLVKFCDLQVNLTGDTPPRLRSRYVAALAAVRAAMGNDPPSCIAMREAGQAAADVDRFFLTDSAATSTWGQHQHRAGAVLVWCQNNGWHFHAKLSAYLLEHAMIQRHTWQQSPSSYFDMARCLNAVLLEVFP